MRWQIFHDETNFANKLGAIVIPLKHKKIKKKLFIGQNAPLPISQKLYFINKIHRILKVINYYNNKKLIMLDKQHKYYFME